MSQSVGPPGAARGVVCGGAAARGQGKAWEGGRDPRENTCDKD